MNVICIMSDSLRPDYVSAYGSRIGRTPNLDRIISMGSLFGNSYAEMPLTFPSRVSFVTGRYSFAHRSVTNYAPIRRDEITLAEIMQANRYRTACIGDSPPTFRKANNFQRGFEHFQVVPGHFSDVEYTPEPVLTESEQALIAGLRKRNDQVYYARYLSFNRNMKTDKDYFPARTTRAAIKWLKERPDGKFFLWLDYFDPHEPWNPPPPFDRMYDPDYGGVEMPLPETSASQLSKSELHHIRCNYAAMVFILDKWIGLLLDELARQDVLKETFVCLLSDHGEPLGEHEVVRKGGAEMFDEDSKIVLAISGPGIRAGRRNSALASNVDLLPTLLDYLAIEPPKAVQGKTLRPVIEGKCDEVRDALYAGFFRRHKMLRTKAWKLLYHCGAEPAGLYNMMEDPEEERNLCAEFPEKAGEMQKLLLDFLIQHEDGNPDIPF